jgi:molybdate transport system substrate-binding protein
MATSAVEDGSIRTPMLKRLLPAIFSLLLAAPLFAQSPLRLAAAADLEPVLPPILAQFQKQTGIQVETTY